MRELKINECQQITGADLLKDALIVVGSTVAGGYLLSYIPYTEFFMDMQISSAGTSYTVNQTWLYLFAGTGALAGFAGSVIGIYLRDHEFQRS